MVIICLTNFVNIRKHQEATFCKHDTKDLIIHLMTFWHFPHCDAVQDFKELVAAAKEAGIKLLMETQRHQKRSPGDLMGELRFDGKTVETNRTESVTHLKVYEFMTRLWQMMTVATATLENPSEYFLCERPGMESGCRSYAFDDRSCLNFYMSILDP